MICKHRDKAWLMLLALLAGYAEAGQSGDVLINEFYWHTTGGGEGHDEAVELLVTRDGMSLDGLVITDANHWDRASEHRVMLRDRGRGVFARVPAGTLVVVYNGRGEDDLDHADHVLRIYAQSSAHADLSPENQAFRLDDKGDNLHVFKVDQQLHYVKYNASDYPQVGGGHPGQLQWYGAEHGTINVGLYQMNAGTRFVGASPAEAMRPDQYESYVTVYPVTNNLGVSNGGRNTAWVAQLRGMTEEQLRTHEARMTGTLLPQDPPLDRIDIVTAPRLFPLEQFHIQAHRGAGTLLPENTLLAFDYAWAHGVVPEADVRTTKDCVLVAFHDDHLRRVVKNVSDDLAERSMADLTYDQVALLDVGGWMGEQFAGTRVPRMDDIFAILQRHPDRSLYLDVKDVDLTDLARMVQSYGIDRQVILASRHHSVHVRWKSMLPQSNTLQWIGGTSEKIRMTVEQLRRQDFVALTSLQVHVHYDPAQDDPFRPASAFLAQLGRDLRERHIRFQVLPLRINDPRAYDMLLNLGVVSFATDHIDATQSAVARYYQQTAP